MKHFLMFFFVLNSSFISAQSYFSIIDDDAVSVSAVSSVKRVADKKNVKVSFAVVAQKLCYNPELVRVLLDFQKQGHGVCNHSLTHSVAYKTNPTEKMVEYEIIRSEEILDSLGFCNHDYFVYPYGKFSYSTYEWLIPLVRKYFRMSFDSRGYGNDVNGTNRFNISRLPLRKHDNLFVIKRIIDEAVANNQWLVFLNHSGMSRDYSEELLESVITYCQAKGMRCVTVQEADKLGLLQNSNAPISSWSNSDEVFYLLYMHVGWFLLFLGIVLGLILFIVRWNNKRLSK